MAATKNGFKAYEGVQYEEAEMLTRSKSYYDYMAKRRSVRTFSDQAVPKAVIDHIIMTAATAPSGAHKQPWIFCAVSDPEIKKAIRVAAEQEEYENYNGRMSEEWLEDLVPFGTDWHKPFLTTAP